MYQYTHKYIHVKCYILECVYIDTYTYIHVKTKNKKDVRHLKES